MLLRLRPDAQELAVAHYAKTGFLIVKAYSTIISVRRHG